jgi:TonB family protein
MRPRLILSLLLLLPASSVAANKVPVSKLLDRMVHRSTLAEPGGKPFYLKATVTAKDDAKSPFNGTVEWYWVSPAKWRRVIALRDFSQTRVVNGGSIYEENKGDYFPVHDEMLANEIVDPLPKPAVDLMGELGMMGTEPGSGMGQCMAEKYFNGADGRENRVLLAYDCNTGLLIYLWSPSCCYGVMTDYRKFHNKMVAYATKDDPINIRVDSLRDLENPDESLFAVSQPTPPAQRMTREKVTDGEARAILVAKTEIQWPHVTKKPNGDHMSVDIVIGRDGRVKEASSYSPVENAVEDAALNAINQWTFQPQMVDGVPAQVETTLTIPFPAEMLSVAAPGPAVAPLFERMRAMSSLRLEGGPGFHMKASFHSEDGSAKGMYEETWISPKRWRKEVRLNDASIIELRTEDAFYRIFPGKSAPRIADDVIDVLSFNLPGDNGSDFHESDWSPVNAKLGEVPLLRLSRGYVNAQGRPEALTEMYYVEEKTGFLRRRYHYSALTVFNDFQPFGAKNVSRKLTMMGGDVTKLEIILESLEVEPNVSDNTFTLTGVKPLYTSADEDGRFTQPRPVSQVVPHIAGWRGKVRCGVTVDERGHVRAVEVKDTTDQSVITPIRAALMTWEFEPARINGHPSLGFIDVTVQ